MKILTFIQFRKLVADCQLMDSSDKYLLLWLIGKQNLYCINKLGIQLNTN